MIASELRAVVKLYNAVVSKAEGVNDCASILDAENDDVVEFLESVMQNAVDCIEIAYVAGLEYKNEKFLAALNTLKQMLEDGDYY